jgi:hypothetical protein
MKHPNCRLCGRPMMVGQIDTHYTCKRQAEMPPEPFQTALEASQAAADTKWSPLQQAQVDSAIRRAAAKKTFITADDVWAHLPETFPVTKGLAARLNVAARKGYIENTGTTTVARRGGTHDHAQRLTLWRSLIEGRDPMNLDRKDRR